MRVILDDKIVFNDNGTATVTKRSGISGKMNTCTMPLTQEQFKYWDEKGYLIQEAMPHLSAEDREFLMTGITPEEWEENFRKEE